MPISLPPEDWDAATFAPGGVWDGSGPSNMQPVCVVLELALGTLREGGWGAKD